MGSRRQPSPPWTRPPPPDGWLKTWSFTWTDPQRTMMWPRFSPLITRFIKMFRLVFLFSKVRESGFTLRLFLHYLTINKTSKGSGAECWTCVWWTFTETLIVLVKVMEVIIRPKKRTGQRQSRNFSGHVIQMFPKAEGRPFSHIWLVHSSCVGCRCVRTYLPPSCWQRAAAQAAGSSLLVL